MKQEILIVEDETRLADLLKDYLEAAGFCVHCVYRGDEVAGFLADQKVDLILLDLMLPGKDGLDVTRQVRSDSQVPIIMMTARVEEIDRLLGLELGADDYICKPFSYREVVARVKAVLRRTSVRDEADTTASFIELDADRFQVKLMGQAMALTAIEFELFRTMAEQPGRIFTRENLMDRIYTDGRIVSDRTIDSHIRKLRAKVKELSPDQEIIVSVYSVGYKVELP